MEVESMSDNIDEIINKVKSNSSAENKKIVEGLINNLSESQSHTVQNILSDKELIKKLLSSEQAKNLINKLGGD